MGKRRKRKLSSAGSRCDKRLDWLVLRVSEWVDVGISKFDQKLQPCRYIKKMTFFSGSWYCAKYNKSVQVVTGNRRITGERLSRPSCSMKRFRENISSPFILKGSDNDNKK